MFIVVICFLFFFCFCFVKQKTAYEMRISDWSSDVCSSDLDVGTADAEAGRLALVHRWGPRGLDAPADQPDQQRFPGRSRLRRGGDRFLQQSDDRACLVRRSEEHPSELQSLMRISYAVFSLTKHKHTPQHKNSIQQHPN